MFDNVEVVINGNTIKGIPAILIMITPFIACILLGIMIGSAL